MSRTFRRKHYEESRGGSWAVAGFKTNGFFTTCDWEYVKNAYGYYVRTESIYRPMDKRERWKAIRFAHSDNHRNAHSPSHWYRLNRQKENRSINKRELSKWFHYAGEYEPMFEENPRSHYWDWS
jgi:hypothetical protein